MDVTKSLASAVSQLPAEAQALFSTIIPQVQDMESKVIAQAEAPLIQELHALNESLARAVAVLESIRIGK